MQVNSTIVYMVTTFQKNIIICFKMAEYSYFDFPNFHDFIFITLYIIETTLYSHIEINSEQIYFDLTVVMLNISRDIKLK